MHIGATRVPIFVRRYLPPNDSYAIVAPQGYLAGGLWSAWVDHCRRHAYYDPHGKHWVWGTLQIERLTSENSTPQISKEELREARRKAEEEFERGLAELTKAENVPQDQWPNHQYPDQIRDCAVAPTALQRILVRKYWDQPAALLGASVGTGKSRMVVDMLSARALAPNAPSLNDSARIVLLVAPLSLHENWKREIVKWARPDVEWKVHKFRATKEFWKEVEWDAAQLFDGPKMAQGGLVIITTPQSLSRCTFTKQLTEHQYVPTAIVLDECQRLFRNPNNAAYLTVQKLRRDAHCIIALSGTPTSKLEDFHALEELLTPGEHWRGATYEDYARLGDPMSMTSSGLWMPHYHSFERAVKEYHGYRIGRGRIFLADKRFYMADSLPGLEQSELGEFADERLSFRQLFENYPAHVDEAYDLQQKYGKACKSDYALAQTLLLRMQQCSANSDASNALLRQFIDDFLEKDEPAVVWVGFRNSPCEELQTVVRTLLEYGTCGWIMGEQKEDERWAMVDGFQQGKLRFLVAQTEAGGVGLNLVRASKCFFHTTPFGFQAVQQCVGRLHRIGQENDVTSFYGCAHPITAFSRQIYSRRAHLNDEIPKQIGELVKKYASSN